jgi:calcineurin-like phosphoesterase family protein
MSNVFFTADTHFGHKGVIKHCNRPFETVEEMDEAIIARWNERITKHDTVLHMGDVGLFNDKHTLECVSRLNGTKHLILGNHDAPWPGNKRYARHFQTWARFFESMSTFAMREIAGEDVLFSHFPYRGDHVGYDRSSQFRLRDEGKFLVHGHVHTEWLWVANQYNVGVDVHDFYPVELSEVAKTINFKREAMAALDAIEPKPIITGSSPWSAS